MEEGTCGRNRRDPAGEERVVEDVVHGMKKKKKKKRKKKVDKERRGRGEDEANEPLLTVSGTPGGLRLFLKGP